MTATRAKAEPAGGGALRRVREAYRRIAEADRPEVWIGLRPQEEAEREAAEVDARRAAGAYLPLAGTVFAVKGNIDLTGLPTTAGCPSFARLPEADAPAVARLRAGGSVPLGTTNLDQFATGLVGTRSPYGAVRGAVDPARVAGGSSSGSAVAVALGLVDLALGTDTAGSGRVPAAFNGIVGLKPTGGVVPTTGVVPACRSLDCVSVFARSVDAAELAYGIIADPVPVGPAPRRPGPWRVAVPALDRLGELDEGWGAAYTAAADRLAAAGADLRDIDLAPFGAVARMLYEGAFVAERYDAVGEFIERQGDAADLDPVVRGIITAGRDIPAHRLYRDLAVLARLRDVALAELGEADALLLPTTPGHPTLAEVAADPVGANSRLGRFTNSTNLLGLCALAVPAGQVRGLPFGVMLIGRPHTESRLAVLARLLAAPPAPAAASAAAPTGPPAVRLAVLGAHLTGQPLNGQLLALGATLATTTRTAPDYRLYALDTVPAKPGLVRVPSGGASVEAEVWELPAAGLGALTAALPEPMAIGSVRLADGSRVAGFLCEPAALAGAEDITGYGGWRGYLAAHEPS
ncbi:allophanate hydrolase [Kitasatospora sp. NBC_00240]|uniref:allophanate hydrolase n=1 Tax=Kitasatospora sp. NBC_00240 TaxID=2903567 RepID=UPI00225A8C4F|nr:allophanate hydrolase [Kitasatospora sp. NBC_00240]MCX5209323.1 allophanate hydrolase [Kitasatospora sp. NBC_00240]